MQWNKAWLTLGLSEQLESDIKAAHSEVKDAKASHKRVEIELSTMQDEIAEAQVRMLKCSAVTDADYIPAEQLLESRREAEEGTCGADCL